MLNNVQYTYMIEVDSKLIDFTGVANSFLYFQDMDYFTTNKIIGTTTATFISHDTELFIRGLVNWQYHARDIYIVSFDVTGKARIQTIPVFQKTRNTYLFSYALNITGDTANLIFYEHKKNYEAKKKSLEPCEFKPSQTVLTGYQVNLLTGELSEKKMLHSFEKLCTMPRIFVWTPYYDGSIKPNEMFAIGNNEDNTKGSLIILTFN
jgi:hypothetical protein